MEIAQASVTDDSSTTPLNTSLLSSLSIPHTMLHLRQGIVAGYQADPLDHFIGTNGHLGRFNRFDFGVLTPRITKNCSNFGNLGSIEFSPQAQRHGRRFDNSGNSSGIEFSTGCHLEDDSNVSSPPLWKTSPPTTPTNKDCPFHLLSPTSRSRAIARGQHELMEMIQNMPESAYELSLKDLIELPTAAGENRGSMSEAIPEEKMKKRKNNKRHAWSGSTDSKEFLLKMFFPAALSSKKSSSSNGTRSKVSPKPQQMEGEKIGLEKSVDGEWWKKRFSSTGESVNSRASRTSSSSIGSSRRHIGCLPGCWPFFHTNKNEARAHTGCFF